MQVFFERVGQHDAIYTEAELRLHLTVEAFQNPDGTQGIVIYLSSSDSDSRNPKLTLDRRSEVEKSIRRILDAKGQKYSIE